MGVKSFLASHPKFAANYNQLGSGDQGRWQNKFQAGGAANVKQFTQDRMGRQQMPRATAVGNFQPMQQMTPQGIPSEYQQTRPMQQMQRYQQMQPNSQNYQMGPYAQGQRSPASQYASAEQQFDAPQRSTSGTLQQPQPGQSVPLYAGGGSQYEMSQGMETNPQMQPGSGRGYQMPQQSQIPQGVFFDQATGQWRQG